jgi:hypothetical protein
MSNAAIGDIHQPVTEQIRARFETVGAEPAKGRVTSFEAQLKPGTHGTFPAIFLRS